MNGHPTSGKQRASRIPLDYYKHGDPLTRRKTFWTLLSLLFTVVWCLILFPAWLTPGINSTPVGFDRFSHGQVCRAHAAIGHECQACHVNFPMLGGRDSLTDVLGGARSTFKGDLKCLECHLGEKRAGKMEGYLAVHSPVMKVGMTPNCGTCHQDHKGLDRDLKRVADDNCTTCHKSIHAALEGGGTMNLGNVSSFQTEHPRFRSIETKNISPTVNQIKFNHAYHMTDGIVLTQGGKPFTVADMVDGSAMKAAFLSKAGGNPSAPIRMDCADCHRPEQRNDRAWTGEKPIADVDKKDEIQKAFADRRLKREPMDWAAGTPLVPPRTPGAYMQPIKYEAHCAACHPTTFAPGLPAVKHGLQPEVGPNGLSAAVGKIVDEARSSLPAPTASFPLPGKAGATAQAMTRDEQKAFGLRALLEGKRACGECHIDEKGSDLSIATKQIARPSIPEVWMKHGKFDHAQHSESKGISCRECHPQAYAYADDSRTKWNEVALRKAYAMPNKGAEIVMLPQLENCRQCHSPKPAADVAVKRGLEGKYDCTECHNFHHGVPKKK